MEANLFSKSKIITKNHSVDDTPEKATFKENSMEDN
jgi:hypothetical protein